MDYYIITRRFGRLFYALDIWGRWVRYTSPDTIRFANVGAAERKLDEMKDHTACVHLIDRTSR